MQTISNSTVNLESIQNWLVAQLSEQLSLDSNTIDVNESLTRYGLDSIDAVTLVGDLEDWLDLELPDTLFWDHPTIAQAVKFLVDNYEFESDSTGTAETTPLSAEPESVTNNESPKKGLGAFWGKLAGK